MSTRLQGVASRKTVMFVVTAVGTSDLAFIAFCHLKASALKHLYPVTRISVLPQAI